MKKVVSLIVAVVLCMMLAVPAFAASVDFVPSITAKPAPGVTGGSQTGSEPVIEIKDENGKVIYTAPLADLVVTPVSAVQSEDGEYTISEEAAELLRQLYAQMSDPNFNLAEEVPELIAYLESLGLDAALVKDMVITALFDITVLTDELKDYLAVEGNTVDLTFEVDIPDGHQVIVMVYVDGKWQIVEGVVVNADGTITCTFDQVGPVAILTLPIPVEEETEPATEAATATEAVEAEPTVPAEAEGEGCDFNHWWLLLIIPVIAIVWYLVAKNKKKESK